MADMPEIEKSLDEYAPSNWWPHIDWIKRYAPPDRPLRAQVARFVTWARLRGKPIKMHRGLERWLELTDEQQMAALMKAAAKMRRRNRHANRNRRP
jgi:hypothetical protein